MTEQTAQNRQDRAWIGAAFVLFRLFLGATLLIWAA